MARKWLKKSMTPVITDYFRRVGMVAIFSNFLKNKIRVPTRRNGHFLRHYGATVPHKIPYS